MEKKKGNKLATCLTPRKLSKISPFRNLNFWANMSVNDVNKIKHFSSNSQVKKFTPHVFPNNIVKMKVTSGRHPTHCAGRTSRMPSPFVGDFTTCLLHWRSYTLHSKQLAQHRSINNSQYLFAKLGLCI